VTSGMLNPTTPVSRIIQKMSWVYFCQILKGVGLRLKAVGFVGDLDSIFN